MLSHLDGEGEAVCLTEAGDSDLLKGEPKPGEAVLLSFLKRYK